MLPNVANAAVFLQTSFNKVKNDVLSKAFTVPCAVFAFAASALAALANAWHDRACWSGSILSTILKVMCNNLVLICTRIGKCALKKYPDAFDSAMSVGISADQIKALSVLILSTIILLCGF